MSPRPWYAGLGPGDEQAPCEIEPAVCPTCGGTGIDEEREQRALWSGVAHSASDFPCDVCEGSGYASPADYWAACAAELGDL